MGIYSEYLDKKFNLDELNSERKEYLRRISALRDNRDILVYAADLRKHQQAPIAIGQDDLLPIRDQLNNLSGSALDLIIETPGGSGEVAEDIVKAIRHKYDDLSVIVPGWSKSAGTIIAMAGNEILMDSDSALGPIDAQLAWQGKTFSADALLDGMEKIKDEVNDTGVLNKAYIPILQGISPGELQQAQNAQDFSRVLVAEWLAKYKFQNWDVHSSTSQPVTENEKKERAEEIANQLCDHRRWLTHGRSIKLADLDEMGLKITDYSQNEDLSDAIHRYHVLLQMTFETNIYKMIETPESQILRFMRAQTEISPPGGLPSPTGRAMLGIKCPNCEQESKIQANLGKPRQIEDDCLPFPENDKFSCPNCQTEIDLSSQRRELEAQSRQRVVFRDEGVES